jgi:hypothetical protein
MTLTNSSYSSASFEQQLEQERRAFWRAHASWSQATLQQAWSTHLTAQLTELATRVNPASIPRQLRDEFGASGTAPALAKGADRGRLVGVLSFWIRPQLT